MASKDYRPVWTHPHAPEETNDIPVSQSKQDRRMRAAPDDEVEIFDIEDFPTNSHGSFLSTRTMKPYEIEEPDDDSASETQESSLPQQEQTRLWEDLVGSMQDLYCDSDSNNPATMYPSRGRKRKPSNTATSHSQAAEAAWLSTSGRDEQYDDPSLNPKRRRRKGKPPKDHDYSRTTQEQRIRAAEEGGGSSSETLSGDTSGTNIASGCTTADEMDID